MRVHKFKCHDFITSIGNQTSLSGLCEDELRPCLISWEATTMKDDKLREKAVLTAVEAMQESDNYFERAKYIQEKFSAEEEGEWVCIVKEQGAKAQAYGLVYNSNSVFFRVGKFIFDLWQSNA